ncbi:unnamed protein product [Paramecium sonneborni]|uniref:Protein kinase domain-containing protein n=1 Tax=Paramecium sonneborni TaxID=65129 RepID=A0A8S1PB76_9CILI|nr:unnamed protein product [Paramecium sonneborni]
MQQTYQNWIGIQITASTNENPNRNYKIESVIGSGSQGTVFLAKQFMNNFQNRNVAIKIQQNMSNQEIQFLTTLIQHQNSNENIQNPQNYNPSYIVRIYDLFQYNDNWLMVMEQGTQDLFKFIQLKQQISEEKLVQLLKQITKSISFLHENQLIHRDIKPENYIKVGEDYKLIDFGLITAQFRFRKTPNVGTVYYQAPELIDNLSQNYTQAIDVWSLGCLFYEIISGETLMKGNSQDQIQKIILAHKNNTTFLYSKINELNINKDIKDIIISMLDPKPSNRLKAKDVVDLLDSKFSPQKFPITNNFHFPINVQNPQNKAAPLVFQQMPQQQGFMLQQNQVQQQQLQDMLKQMQLQQTLLNSFNLNFQQLFETVLDIKKGQEQLKNEINQIRNDLKTEITNSVFDKLNNIQDNLVKKLDSINEDQKAVKIDDQNKLFAQLKDQITQYQEPIFHQVKDFQEISEEMKTIVQFQKDKKKENRQGFEQGQNFQENTQSIYDVTYKQKVKALFNQERFNSNDVAEKTKQQQIKNQQNVKQQQKNEKEFVFQKIQTMNEQKQKTSKVQQQGHADQIKIDSND